MPCIHNGAMRPVPRGHPARPVSAGARFPYPTRRRTDWCEVGWRVIPFVCAACAAVVAAVL